MARKISVKEMGKPAKMPMNSAPSEDQAEDLGAHGHSPLMAAWRLLMNSEMPCRIRSAAVTGMTVLKG